MKHKAVVIEKWWSLVWIEENEEDEPAKGRWNAQMDALFLPLQVPG